MLEELVENIISLGFKEQNSMCFTYTSAYFIYEIKLVDNLLLDLELTLKDPSIANGLNQQKLDLAIQNFIARFFESEEWSFNFKWLKSGLGICLVEVDANIETLNKFIAHELELYKIMTDTKNAVIH